MATTRLYHPGHIETGKSLTLGRNASHHLVRVVRTKKNTDIILFNGDGFEYSATLLDENSKNCTVAVNDSIHPQRESPVRIILLQGISRNDRMDTSIQKSTELGVSAIIPVMCERTPVKLRDDRAEKKSAHWQQIIVSACEQSGRCVIPELHPVTTYAHALRSLEDGSKFVLTPDSGTGLTGQEIQGSDIYVLIGPESGLTHEETELANQTGFKGIQLGPRILRTETAGPACISAIQTLWGDLG